MKLLKNKIKSFLYGENQIGLVWILFVITLLHLPSAIYGSIFFIPITNDEVNYYTKFGAWFTALSAIFTIINTVVVIYLMIYLHRKSIDISILPYVTELKKSLIDIEIILRAEIDYFDDTQFKTSENLYESLHDHSGFHFDGYADIYQQEIKNLDQIIADIKNLYSIFLTFKSETNNQSTISLKDYKDKLNIINGLNEKFALNKPSSEYKKGFIEGNKYNADPEDMIEASKNFSLESIKNITILLKNETT